VYDELITLHVWNMWFRILSCSIAHLILEISERDVANGCNAFLLDVSVQALVHLQELLHNVADGNDKPASWLELVDERLRNSYDEWDDQETFTCLKEILNGENY